MIHVTRTASRRSAASLLQQCPRTISASLLDCSPEVIRQRRNNGVHHRRSYLSSIPIVPCQNNRCFRYARARRFSSTLQNSTPPPPPGNSITNVADDESSGEEIYQQALEALQQVEELQEAREQQKSEEMHKAIAKAEEKQEQHANNPKAQNLKGVTVVKTVVRQARKELKNSTTIKQQEEEWNNKAQALLQTAALEYGHPQALILLGNAAMAQANAEWMMEDHTRDPIAAKNYLDMALAYYQRAGSATGWFNVGQLLWTGYPAEQDEGKTTPDTSQIMLRPDPDAALKAFREAIALGDPDAMYFVGVHLLAEDDHPANVEAFQEGLALMRSSAELGHGLARYYLALFHLEGHEGLKIDPCTAEEFVDYLNAAADAGAAPALFFRGHNYHEGDNGYPKNYELALTDFLASSEAGDADAAVSAGAMLHEGRPGLSRDQSRAFELYQLAGEMGSLEGWRNVAACYAKGAGVPKSLPTAKYIVKTMLQNQPEGR